MKAKLGTKKESGKITGNMSFAEVMQKYPETAGVFMKQGMSCFGCPMAMQERIEEGIAAHGKDSKKIIEELNKAVQNKK
ncbi:MAG: DUF1858 domain-containing protein [archaeon]